MLTTLVTHRQVRAGMTGASGPHNATPSHDTRELTELIIQLAYSFYVQNTSTPLSKTAHGNVRQYRGCTRDPDAPGTSMDTIVNEAGNVARGRLLDSLAPARSRIAHGQHEPRRRPFAERLILHATEVLQTSVSSKSKMSPKWRQELTASSRA